MQVTPQEIDHGGYDPATIRQEWYHGQTVPKPRRRPRTTFKFQQSRRYGLRPLLIAPIVLRRGGVRSARAQRLNRYMRLGLVIRTATIRHFTYTITDLGRYEVAV